MTPKGTSPLTPVISSWQRYPYSIPGVSQSCPWVILCDMLLDLSPLPQLPWYSWQSPSNPWSHVWPSTRVPVHQYELQKICCRQLKWLGKNIMFKHEVESTSSVWSIKTGWPGVMSSSQGLLTSTRLTPCLACSAWLVRPAPWVQVWCFSAALGMYHQPNNAAVASQARNDWPCACSFGISGEAPLCFVLLLLFLPGAGRSSIPGQRLVGTIFWKVTRQPSLDQRRAAWHLQTHRPSKYKWLCGERELYQVFAKPCHDLRCCLSGHGSGQGRAMCSAIWAHAGEVTLPPALRLRTPVPLPSSRALAPAPLFDFALGTAQASSSVSPLCGQWWWATTWPPQLLQGSATRTVGMWISVAPVPGWQRCLCGLLGPSLAPATITNRCRHHQGLDRLLPAEALVVLHDRSGKYGGKFALICLWFQLVWEDTLSKQE